MPSVLPGVALDVAPRELAAPAPAVNALTQRLVDEAAADAFERGRRTGAEAAAAAAKEAVDHAAAALGAALDAAAAEARNLRLAQAQADVVLARAIAEAVIGREPHDGGEALLRRLTVALGAIDDEPLTAHLSPADAETLAPALAASDPGRLTVTADPSLAPGEARVTGRWAHADLTRAAAWAAIDAVLGEEGDRRD